MYTLNISAQKSPLVSYSFDACDAAGAGISGYDATMNGTLDCVCGLVGESFSFNGGGDALVFPDTLNALFFDDFSIDFYFSLTGVTDVTDILSHRNACNSDSIIALRYFPNSNELLLELAKDIAGYEFVRVELPTNQCWYRVTIVRRGLEYSLFLDNQRVGLIQPDEELPVSKNATLKISDSPCQAVNDLPFLGRIDELKIYDQALTEADLRNTYLFPDVIINRDTTIFIGESVEINVGATCQSISSWTPSVGLDDDTILNPIASPDQSTQYVLSLTDQFCSSQTDINIFVVDPNAFDCAELLLPTAFTPNDDQLNDEFGISNTFIVQDLEVFYILDRWGNKVFETKDKNAKWDGTYGGKKLPPGTYTYVVNYTCQSGTFNKLGTVVLLV